MATIQLRKLTPQNLPDYELLTKHGDDGKLCYCSFWHQKWASMDEYKRIQAENPERLRSCVVDRVSSGFHVGVIAYENDKPCAWVSVGPLPDFYWTWRRVAQVGENAKNVAGILCITVAPEFRGQGMQEKVLNALTDYGRSQGWKTIEAYPFTDEAHEKHGKHVQWAGFPRAFAKAGYEKVGDHWLSSAEAPRLLLSKAISG